MLIKGQALLVLLKLIELITLRAQKGAGVMKTYYNTYIFHRLPHEVG